MNIDNKINEYVEKIFEGATKIVSFCSVYDCTKCTSSTRLYDRVVNFHNTGPVQEEIDRYTRSLHDISPD